MDSITPKDYADPSITLPLSIDELSDWLRATDCAYMVADSEDGPVFVITHKRNPSKIYNELEHLTVVVRDDLKRLYPAKYLGLGW